MTDQSEASIFRRLNGYVKDQGGEIFHTDILHPGFPDKTILLPGGITVFAELKRPKGEIRPGQPYWRKRLQGMGFKADIFYDYQTLIEWIENETQSD